MTNWEKFKEEIIKANIHVAAKTKDGRIGHCSDIECSNCVFNNVSQEGGGCLENLRRWLDEEYEEPKEEPKTCGACRHFHLGEGLENRGICDGYEAIVYVTTDMPCPKYESKGETDDELGEI